jgi:hypothetical protein
MFENRLAEFAESHNLPSESVQELVQLFNEALVEIGQGILKETKPTTKTVLGKTQNQRWASKVAQGYAEENEVTLDDFPGIEKVTKQNILDFLKSKPTSNSSGKSTSQVSKAASPSTNTSPAQPKRKVQCNGLTAKGEPRTRTGTVQPDGSKNCYCFRHADNWKDFENTVSSDSDSDSDLEEEPELEE